VAEITPQAITKKWSVGAELLYSVAEAKPGLSLGLCYLSREGTTSESATEFSLAAGVMGHVQATYAREILPSVHLATRYEVNLNDLHSRTAGGIEFQPTASFPYIFRAKFDTEDGIGLAFGLRLRAGKVLTFALDNVRQGRAPHVGLSFSI